MLIARCREKEKERERERERAQRILDISKITVIPGVSRYLYCFADYHGNYSRERYNYPDTRVPAYNSYIPKESAKKLQDRYVVDKVLLRQKRYDRLARQEGKVKEETSFFF